MLYRGIPASHGIAIGPAFILKAHDLEQPRKTCGSPEEIRGEIQRFRQAVEDVRHDLENIADSVADVVEGRQILEFLLLLLQDPMVKKDVEGIITGEGVNAEYAVSTALASVAEKFNRMSDPYLKERVADVRDVGRRVIAKLTGAEKDSLEKVGEPVVLVAVDLDPSETASLKPEQVMAFVTDMGGMTSHTTILAKGMGIPAVVGLQNITGKIDSLDKVIVDGIHGHVIVDPTREELDYYTEVKRKFNEAEDHILTQSSGPAMTEDGVMVELAANIELPHEVNLVKKFMADGIGLFRTEFIRLLQKNGESEEHHFSIYDMVAREMTPKNVIVRTYDMGGDKFRTGFDHIHEANPFLGYRAVRICLDRPEEFSKQLRAILRASARGNVSLMFPMVTHVDQLRRLRDMLSMVQNDLRQRRVPFNEKMKVGIMVETPATVLALDLMLPYVDFVSIGTNDLTQYTLAVDRGNPRVAELYDYFHPAVLRQIDHVVRTCHPQGKWVGICGSMAGDPLAVPLLLGFGLDELSVAPTLIPDVKKMIGVVTTHGARELARKSLDMETGLRVRALVHSYVVGKYPEILLNEDSWNTGGA
ncbi:MAG TPA: phosphoenolpyruvate--protein phosphotransferase [Candidatus Sabulitectum sp.]|nr:phosphoenolpyruvate--protein phosphotransferase [Candidatus Sabulitectum sp.]